MLSPDRRCPLLLGRQTTGVAPTLLWTDEILHHLETMVETIVCWHLEGESSFQGFLSGGRLCPPSPALGVNIRQEEAGKLSGLLGLQPLQSLMDHLPPVRGKGSEQIRNDFYAGPGFQGRREPQWFSDPGKKGNPFWGRPF